MSNNCSTGSTALLNANIWVKSGAAQCALALGFERMRPGSLGTNFPDHPNPMIPLHTIATTFEETTLIGVNHGPSTACHFANAAQEYFGKYPGANVNHLAEIAAKNYKHSVKNPYS